MPEQFKTEVAAQFDLAIKKLGLSKTKAAEDLQISRQMLHRYLTAKSKPNGKVLRRACQKWGITVTYRGVKFDESAFYEPNKPRGGITAVQIPLLMAIRSLTEKDLEVEVVRKGRNSIDLRVRIKFAS